MSSYMKLVIADDEPNIRDSLSQLFPWEELGIQVVFLAANGREVLDYMEMNPVDLLLADIRMPVMDGLEATRKIRTLEKADSRSIPIIAMTANAFDDDIEKSKAAGMNAHLAKPIEPERLYQTLYDFIFGKEE